MIPTPLYADDPSLTFQFLPLPSNDLTLQSNSDRHPHGPLLDLALAGAYTTTSIATPFSENYFLLFHTLCINVLGKGTQTPSQK